jgi:phosphoenolpyruvate carboxylase
MNKRSNINKNLTFPTFMKKVLSAEKLPKGQVCKGLLSQYAARMHSRMHTLDITQEAEHLPMGSPRAIEEGAEEWFPSIILKQESKNASLAVRRKLEPLLSFSYQDGTRTAIFQSKVEDLFRAYMQEPGRYIPEIGDSTIDHLSVATKCQLRRDLSFMLFSTMQCEFTNIFFQAVSAEHGQGVYSELTTLFDQANLEMDISTISTKVLDLYLHYEAVVQDIRNRSLIFADVKIQEIIENSGKTEDSVQTLESVYAMAAEQGLDVNDVSALITPFTGVPTAHPCNPRSTAFEKTLSELQTAAIARMSQPFVKSAPPQPLSQVEADALAKKETIAEKPGSRHASVEDLPAYLASIQSQQNTAATKLQLQIACEELANMSEIHIERPQDNSTAINWVTQQRIHSQFKQVYNTNRRLFLIQKELSLKYFGEEPREYKPLYRLSDWGLDFDGNEFVESHHFQDQYLQKIQFISNRYSELVIELIQKTNAIKNASPRRQLIKRDMMRLLVKMNAKFKVLSSDGQFAEHTYPVSDLMADAARISELALSLDAEDMDTPKDVSDIQDTAQWLSVASKDYGYHFSTFHIRQEGAIYQTIIQKALDSGALGGSGSMSLGNLDKLLMSRTPSDGFDFDKIFPPGTTSALTPHEKQFLDTFRLVGTGAIDESALEKVVISMFESPLDYLSAALVLKLCGISTEKAATLITPLCEGVESLQNIAKTLETLHASSTFVQRMVTDLTLLIGFSDGSKEASRHALFFMVQGFQDQLAQLQAKLKNKFFIVSRCGRINWKRLS